MEVSLTLLLSAQKLTLLLKIETILLIYNIPAYRCWARRYSSTTFEKSDTAHTPVAVVLPLHCPLLLSVLQITDTITALYPHD